MSDKTSTNFASMDDYNNYHNLISAGFSEGDADKIIQSGMDANALISVVRAHTRPVTFKDIERLTKPTEQDIIDNILRKWKANRGKCNV